MFEDEFFISVMKPKEVGQQDAKPLVYKYYTELSDD